MTAETLVNNLETFVIWPITWFLFALALILFLWGVAEFLIKFGSDEGQKAGKRHMLWGIIGMAIMMSAIGIFHLIGSTIYQGDFPSDPREFKPSDQLN
jgi:ABC-type phosphate transport system permease subunit